MSRRARVALVVVMLVSASTCGDSSPTAPATAPPEVGSGQLRISGLPPSLRPSATAQLTAQHVMGNGTERECAASWSIDDPQVASLSATGLLTARNTGYGTVMASCAGLSARGETKVEAPVSQSLLVLAHDSALPPDSCLRATMELLDGPLAGGTVTTGCFGFILPRERYGGVLPVKVRFTAESYESKDFIISEATRATEPNRFTWSFLVPMTFVADPLTDTFVLTLKYTDRNVAIPFTLRSPGAVRVRTRWALDYNDRLFVELWCDGQRLREYSERMESAGGFTQDVQSAGACEVKLTPAIGGFVTLRVAITYPR